MIFLVQLINVILIFTQMILLYILFINSDAIHVEKILQNEIFCVYEWLKTNKLSLNLTKTVSMIITTQQNIAKNGAKILNVNCDGVSISNVSVFKYLGIHFDKNVNFNYMYHIGQWVHLNMYVRLSLLKQEKCYIILSYYLILNI